jgi:hypothetical protein
VGLGGMSGRLDGREVVDFPDRKEWGITAWDGWQRITKPLHRRCPNHGYLGVNFRLVIDDAQGAPDTEPAAACFGEELGTSQGQILSTSSPSSDNYDAHMAVSG